MYNTLIQKLYRIEHNPIFSSIRKGFMLIIPIILAGSIAQLINNFPIPSYQVFLENIGGGVFKRLLNFIFDSTSGLMSAFLVLSISYYYAEKFEKENPIIKILAMFTSLACFSASFGGIGGSLTLSSFGMAGVFTAMLCAILATKLFFLLDIKMFHRLRSYTAGADIHYRSSISAILPVLICVAAFGTSNMMLNTFFHVQDLNELISNGMIHLFENGQARMGSGVLFTFLLNLLWGFGIHGGNGLNHVSITVFGAQNGDSSSIVSKAFMDNFAQIGGSGATLCMLLAILLVARSENIKKLAKTSAPLVLFNINELLVFGFPIVLNPLMILPFLIVPVCSFLIAYGAAVIGWMPIVHNTTAWTTPVLFSGYLTTGSLNGVVVQIIIVAVGTLIYIPFIRFAERVAKDQTDIMLEELVSTFKENEKNGLVKKYLSGDDNIGTIAKTITGQLRRDIDNKQIMMYYQPQIDRNDSLVGAEALLRWKFEGKVVYPPLIIALAKEDHNLFELTETILDKVCQDLQIFTKQLDSKFQVSANLIAEQVDNTMLVNYIITLAKKYGIEKNLILEVTEESSLNEWTHIPGNINILREYGIMMAIDDFSMGQTSLKYLENNQFCYVKLDGSLVRQIEKNDRCKNIVSSIIRLGDSLNFEVTAEYVENKNIHDILFELGCHYYQGYYYSPALELSEFTAFYKLNIK